MEELMTDDTCATLLLCAFQGGEKEHLPLTVDEYNRVAHTLHRSDQRPSDLLGSVLITDVSHEAEIQQDRLAWLLDRRINLGFTLEQWYRAGIWVLSRSDLHYPACLRKNMGNQAPPLIYGTGHQHLGHQDTLAIMGPDSISNARISKVGDMAEDLADQQKTVVTIGALKLGKKVVQSVYEHGGRVLWVLSGGHLKLRLKKPYRQAIRDENLTMIAMQSPATPSTSDEEAALSQVAASQADEILYVDGVNSKDIAKRVDRYQAFRAALNRPSQCSVFHGQKLTPEAQELLKSGASSWDQKSVDGPNTDANPSEDKESSHQGDLFG
ncbi:MAG: DNA-processing protein DprA [Bacteroidetes bacterium]|nr:DNA-processing protein DprA [Bacteroidota bacterium]